MRFRTDICFFFLRQLKSALSFYSGLYTNMQCTIGSAMVTILLHFLIVDTITSDGDYFEMYPTVTIAFRVHNHAHMLPYFLGQLEDLDYPKDRMSIFIRTDRRNTDASRELVDWWTTRVRIFYAHVDYQIDDDVLMSIADFNELAMSHARRSRTNYILLIDCHHLLVNQRTLQLLIAANQTIIAPLMVDKFSNISNDFVADDEQQRGSFRVSHLSTDILFIHMSHPDAAYLTFNSDNIAFYSGTDDDHHDAVFAASALNMNIDLYINNKHNYGYRLDPLDDARESMRHLAMTLIADDTPLLHSPYAPPPYPAIRSRLGFDHIYVINMRRRPERLEKLDAMLRLLGIDYSWWPAVDGSALTIAELDRLGVRMLDNYRDPYHQRPLKLGEIGCFLSHHAIWTDMRERHYRRVLIFEDDLRFERNIRLHLSAIINDLDNAHPPLDWDLIYIGRKRLSNEHNRAVPGQRYLTAVGYSYWTLAYALSASGAEKLLAAKPLSRLVPVDEYLPIMFDAHPNAEWKAAFVNRNLRAFTSEPLLVSPARYTNQPGYVSDTEDSALYSPPVTNDGSRSKDEL